MVFSLTVLKLINLWKSNDRTNSIYLQNGHLDRQLWIKQTVKLFLKHCATWTGNLDETGGIENIENWITDPDGTQIYLIVFIKKDRTRLAKTCCLGRPHNLRADSDFYVVLQNSSLHGLRTGTFALIVSAHPYCARNSLPRHALSARAVEEMWRYIGPVGTLV